MKINSEGTWQRGTSSRGCTSRAACERESNHPSLVWRGRQRMRIGVLDCTPMRVLLCSILVFMSALTPIAAQANGRFPASNQISFHPLSDNVMVARTTFGLLVTRDGGENFSWVCEQLLQTRMLEDPAVLVMGDGSTLVSQFVGQRRGTPDDCTWDFVSEELTNRVVIDSIGDPTNPAAAWIITSDGARTNAVWRTTDYGVSWTKISEDFEDVLFETIEVAPTNTSRLYLTGALPPTTSSPRQPFVYRSDNGGESWERFPYDLETGTQTDLNIFLAAVDPANEDRIFVRVLGAPDDKLVVSDDGGESFHKVVSFAGMLGFARSTDGQRVWVAGDLGENSPGLYISEDRGEAFDPVTSFVNLPDGGTAEIPVRASCLAVRGNELWACGNNYSDKFTLGVSTDLGATFTPVLTFADVGPPPSTCGVSTDVQSTCGPLYPDLMTLLSIDGGVVPFEDAGTATPREPSCACDASNGSRASLPSVFALATLLFAVMGRARRRRRSPERCTQ